MTPSERHLADTLDEMFTENQPDIIERMLAMCKPTFSLYGAYSLALRFLRLREETR